MQPDHPPSTPSTPCPRCGRTIPPDAPGGLCPSCALQSAVEPGGGPDPGGEPGIEAVRVAFPELEIVERIGAGGMGVVFKARQPALDRWVALKVLPERLAADPTFVERLRREARLLARLSHPNIVAVHDVGQSGPFCYLLLEYVDGVNLRQAMQAGRFSPGEALGVVPRICEALQYAHDHGVLHRDIKPENILLDAAGRVKIADFGIAKLVGDPRADITLTESGARLGTPHYMAPEQVEDPARVDHRADIYSLGVVFYEMLTGELPIGRFSVPSTKATLDARVDEIVLRALAKERELRQQSAGEVKTQVEGLARPPAFAPGRSGPSSAAPPGVSTTALNWAAGLTGAGLFLALPSLLLLRAAAFWMMRSTSGGGMGLSYVEVIFILATLLPAASCGVAGTWIGALQIPAFRRGGGRGPGQLRLAFAVGTLPVLAAMGLAAILVGVTLQAAFRMPPVTLAAAVLASIAAGTLATPALWRHLSGTRWNDRATPVPGRIWLLQTAAIVAFLTIIGGPGLVSSLYLANGVNRPPHPVHASSRPGQGAILAGTANQPPQHPPGTLREYRLSLHVPAGRTLRLTARLWSNGIALPTSPLTVDVPGTDDPRESLLLAWRNHADGGAGEANPGWSLALITTGPDGQTERRFAPNVLPEQPETWSLATFQGSIAVLDPDPGARSAPSPARTITLLSGMAGSRSGASVPWVVTLEPGLLPPEDARTAEIAERDLARTELDRLRQQAAEGLLAPGGREILDAEYRVALAEALANRDSRAIPAARLEHARKVLALAETGLEAGITTAAEIAKARAELDRALAGIGTPPSP